MLLRIGKIIDNSMLKAADFVEYAEHLGIHADIVTQGDYVYICLGRNCAEKLGFI